MKVFRPGHALTNEDLVFVFTTRGVSSEVDDIAAKIFYLDLSRQGTHREMFLNDAVIRFDEDEIFYWLDAQVSYGLPMGSYEIAWIFEVDGVTRMAVDEFSVVGEN